MLEGRDEDRLLIYMLYKYRGLCISHIKHFGQQPTRKI